MKISLLIFVSFIILSIRPYCQCPQPGLKIQSAACQEPKNLKTHSITCSELTVSWAGTKDQTYIVRATGTKAATNSVVELKSSKSKCDNNDNCEATIPVNEGSDVTWSVQSVCTIEGASLFSAEVKGPDVYIPRCPEIKESKTLKALQLNVFPNPSTGYLVVQYSGNTEGIMEFRIYDVTGKQAFTSIKTASIKTSNRYKLDVHSLPPGAYMLETTTGNTVGRSKFVLMKK